MAEYVDIALSDLIVDERNARLRNPQANEQAALLAIAEQQKRRLLNLAGDIVEHGLDPTSIVAVVSTNDQKKRYIVIEGNRRVAALKALETPSIISPALDSGGQTQLNKLAADFAESPIITLPCVLFESEDDLEHWVTLRHTGQNNGVGLVDWGAEEKERYATRHGRSSSDSPAGQILEFVKKHGGLSEEAQGSDKGIITSLRRLINTPRVREKLGIQVSGGQVSTLYPAAEVAKSLTRVVEDLKTEEIKVGDIYHSQQRIDYAESLPVSELPDSSTRLGSATLLENVDDLDTGDTAKPTETRTRRRKRQSVRARTALIPQDCRLNIDPPRINNIYIELLNLSVDQYPNASSVSFRVFVELSVDHYIKQNNLGQKEGREERNLAKRLRVVADDLERKKLIDVQLKRAVHKVANSQHGLSAGTTTFNQYVHNPHVYPTASELRTAWDELQPFVEQLWS